jgi:hypothetical protein
VAVSSAYRTELWFLKEAMLHQRHVCLLKLKLCI